MQQNMLCLVVLATLACLTQAMPQNQIGLLEKHQQEPKTDIWRPTQEKDKWRAFEPVKNIPTLRWWELRQDDKLWEVPGPLDTASETSNTVGPAVDKTSEEIPEKSAPDVQIDTTVSEAQVEDDVQVNKGSSSETEGLQTGGKPKGLNEISKSYNNEESSDADVDRTNDGNASPDTDAEKETTKEKKKIPGETGYLRPFYRKGDNNPFVDEEDKISAFGKTGWRGGVPFLPILHHSDPVATPVQDSSRHHVPVGRDHQTPLASPDIVVKEGGTSGSDSVEDTQQASHIDGVANNEDNQNKEIDNGAEVKAETVPHKELVSTDEDIPKGKQVDTQLSKSPIPVAQTVNKPVKVNAEIPNAHKPWQMMNDAPFEDFPDWDNSLFDYVDGDSEKAAKSKISKQTDIKSSLDAEEFDSKNEDIRQKRVKSSGVEQSYKDERNSHKTVGKLNIIDVPSDDVIDSDDSDENDNDSDEYDDEDDEEYEDESDEDEDSVDESSVSDDDDDDDEFWDSSDSESDDEDDDSVESDSADESDESSDDDDDDFWDSSDNESDDEDEDDDAYYYDDGYGNSSDEDRYEVIEEESKPTTITPIKSPVALPQVSNNDQDASDKTNETPASSPDTDQTHHSSPYSTGTIYDTELAPHTQHQAGNSGPTFSRLHHKSRPAMFRKRVTLRPRYSRTDF